MLGTLNSQPYLVKERLHRGMAINDVLSPFPGQVDLVAIAIPDDPGLARLCHRWPSLPGFEVIVHTER